MPTLLIVFLVIALLWAWAWWRGDPPGPSGFAW